jgi:pyruvate dehydrogenase E1 component beta subunit
MTGVAIGAALNGKRPIFVHARNDFMFLALDQLINNAAKWKYNFAGASSAPIVVRSIIGKGWGQGPTHSQSIQSLVAHIPGLFVAMPSSPYTAKGILLKSLEIDTPVILFEHRSLYDKTEDVPLEPYTIEFGKARIAREGKDITVVATSMMVQEALKAADILEKHGISVEVVDPISLSPLDEDAIIASVEKTGRLVCVDTSWLRCGIASEISAIIAEKAFKFLKAPIKRIAWPDSPCPVSKVLEEVFYRDFRDVARACCELLEKDISCVIHEQRREDRFVGPY